MNIQGRIPNVQVRHSVIRWTWAGKAYRQLCQTGTGPRAFRKKTTGPAPPHPATDFVGLQMVITHPETAGRLEHPADLFYDTVSMVQAVKNVK